MTPVRSRLSISTGLFAAARIHRTKMSSRAPAAILLRTNRNQPPRRNHTSRGRDPGRACAHTPVPIEPCPLFLGNQECPHYLEVIVSRSHFAGSNGCVVNASLGYPPHSDWLSMM